MNNNNKELVSITLTKYKITIIIFFEKGTRSIICLMTIQEDKA